MDVIKGMLHKLHNTLTANRTTSREFRVKPLAKDLDGEATLIVAMENPNRVLIAHRTQQRSLGDHEGHVLSPKKVAEVYQHLEHQISAT